ncbi:MAG: siderophore biosynthesis protein SbnE, partial [Staphylococcus equorum]|nr:siderophore biosynthesis protein SbnE [Staphylococcus equorum]
CAQDNGTSSQLAPMEVIEHLFEMLAQQTEDEETSELRAILHNIYLDINNSVKRTALYLTRAQQQQTEDEYIISEQSLYLGHPFHPTPKSSVGFSEEDLLNYAPECQAQFQLYYIQVERSIMLERYVEGRAAAVNELALQLAQLDTDDIDDGYTLLPLHPYQITGLKDNAKFKQWMDDGFIKDIGISGHYVYPTSSVRTVFSKEHNVYLKLPINVKITNFVRTNDHEQVERTIDAASVIASIKPDYETKHFKLMFEEGYRALKDSPEAGAFDLLANTAMIVREGIEDYHSEKQIHVLASLFETMPHEPDSMLGEMITQSGLSDEEWLSAYLDITLYPMLELLSETGISLEGHVQNTLIEFKDGHPQVCYVRDLEGVCIAEDIAKRAQIIPHIIQSESPVVYSNEAAWHRFKYYIIVNHLGHLVATMGKRVGSETILWQTLRNKLLDWSQDASISTQMKIYVDDLYESSTFSAKANFLSKIKACGDNPIYTNIPNPMFMEEEVRQHDAQY